jgi:23S rRNA (cytidine1920-2'-O)/16S rRNA (cytidine1409-2'-O)-methyltransferase
VSTRRTRLDVLLVERGLAETRAKAQALILAGQVHVAGHTVVKAGMQVAPDVDIQVAAPDHPWVSRGGIKLAHALDAFAIDVSGRIGLDIGASTGGFTDVLLQRGARHVTAVDVGHGQLHWKLRSDPRVTLHEGVNARALSRGNLPELSEGAQIVAIDVAFISLTYILPVIPPLLAPGGDVVALIKPQFEAGRDEVGEGGIVRDPAIQRRVVERVTASAAEVGLTRLGLVESSITGAEGNKEWLAHFRLAGETSAAGHL